MNTETFSDTVAPLVVGVRGVRLRARPVPSSSGPRKYRTSSRRVTRVHERACATPVCDGKAEAVGASAQSAAALIAGAADLLAAAARRVDAPLLTVGIVLHLAAEVVRNCGWHGVLRAAGPEQQPVRLRDVQAAAFAGGGVNAVVPARAGDAVKVLLIRRRAPAARLSTLTATFLPETVFEWAAGALMLAWVLAAGYLPAGVVTGALAGSGHRAALSAAAAAGAAVALAAAYATLRRRAYRLWRDICAGLAILGRPRDFAVRVASWQLLARLIRLVAIACCLAAWGLPGDLRAAAVAMAIDGGTRVRFAPATTGLRVALLAYALPAATGTAVSVGAVIAYVAGVRAVRTVLSLGIAAAVLGATLGARSPRRALAALRRLGGAAADPAGPVPANVADGAGSR